MACGEKTANNLFCHPFSSIMLVLLLVASYRVSGTSWGVPGFLAGLFFCVSTIGACPLVAASPLSVYRSRLAPWTRGGSDHSKLSEPRFDSPLVQGVSRTWYTDQTSNAATGPYWPKGACTKKRTTTSCQPKAQRPHANSQVLAFSDTTRRQQTGP